MVLWGQDPETSKCFYSNIRINKMRTSLIGNLEDAVCCVPRHLSPSNIEFVMYNLCSTPQTVVEAAKDALSFWSYQKLQQIAWQEHQTKYIFWINEHILCIATSLFNTCLCYIPESAKQTRAKANSKTKKPWSRFEHSLRYNICPSTQQRNIYLILSRSCKQCNLLIWWFSVFSMKIW